MHRVTCRRNNLIDLQGYMLKSASHHASESSRYTVAVLPKLKMAQAAFRCEANLLDSYVRHTERAMSPSDPGKQLLSVDEDINIANQPLMCLPLSS